ncbi:MAG TPA: alpha-ketoglutarate-dependent dioxygenase AlkB [Bacteroidia bacterium]|jgi:alkylated DNA repair dioxygenase AlkB
MEDLFSSQEEIFRSEPFAVSKLDFPDSDITLYNGFFSKEESDIFFNKLLNDIEWRQDKMTFYEKVYDLPRLTAWYGDIGSSYTYSNIPMNPKPWTNELLKIKERIEKISNTSFTSVLINLYRKGSDSVSWHSDDEKELGINPVIGSVSFGESRTFQLKHKHLAEAKANILLTHGSFLLMQGATQHYWKHQIPKSAKVLRQRINLTFRVMEEKH